MVIYNTGEEERQRLEKLKVERSDADG